MEVTASTQTGYVVRESGVMNFAFWLIQPDCYLRIYVNRVVKNKTVKKSKR